MLDIAKTCFIENNILWKRIDRNGTKNTVKVIPKSITTKLITEVDGNSMYRHEGQYKKKERILKSYLWPGMDQHISQHLQQCVKVSNVKRLKRTKG